MKKKIYTMMLVSAIAIASLTGCAKSETANNSIESESVAESTPTESVETEAPHEHNYTEEVTKEATCLEEGEKTFSCECGDTYTETIPVTDHDFTEYVSDEDVTYEADGTETATCSVCGETDTRVAEGSILTYTFEDMDTTKYAKSTVNVRSLPTTDGEKLGGLSTNDEVKVTGKCNETGWYRIEYSEGVAYVSNDYLVDNKVEVASSSELAQVTTQTSSDGLSIILKSGYSYINTTVSSYEEAVAAFRAVGIEPWVTHEDNGTRWCYAIINHGAGNKGNFEADFDAYVWNNFNLSYHWGNRLGTKDGRVYVNDVSGWSWSIAECIEGN